MTYQEAVAFINQDPTATYVVKMDGQFYTLPGSVMRGFLVLSDTVDYLVRF